MLSQVKPFHVKSNQIMSRKCQVKVKSSQVKFRQVKSSWVKSSQFKSHQFKSRHVKFSQVKPRLYPTLGLRTVLYLREIITLLQIYEGSKLDFRSWVLWFVKDPIKHSPFCRRQMSSRREPSDDDIVGQHQQAWLGHPLQAEQVKPAGGARGRYFMSLCVTSTISRYKILIGLNRSPNLTKTPTQPNPIPDAGLIKICRFFEF